LSIWIGKSLIFILVNATKCYKCPNKKGDKSCSSDKDDWKTCNTKGQCLKVTTDIPLVGEDVQRECGGPKGELPLGCKEVTIAGVKGEKCVCEGELCNGAFKAQASIVGMIMLVTFLQCYLI